MLALHICVRCEERCEEVKRWRDEEA
jgi:hypothetical protein